MTRPRRPRAFKLGDFYLPPLPGRDEPPDEGQHRKRDTATGRFRKRRGKKKRFTKKRKAETRAALRKALAVKSGKAPDWRTTCYSATCAGCGRVWLSAIRPIRNNAIRKGASVYLCGKCRD